MWYIWCWLVGENSLWLMLYVIVLKPTLNKVICICRSLEFARTSDHSSAHSGNKSNAKNAIFSSRYSPDRSP